MNMVRPASAEEKPVATGPWSPFTQRAFAVLWIATVLSNVGTWMHDVGAGWLMTELSPSPLVVAMVQAATTLPVFLFALLAGAVADIVDRRKLLIWINTFMVAVAAILTALVYFQAMTPTLLLLVTFLMGTGAAFMAPAWQAIVPKLVPRPQLTSAIALNSMGINISRAIGPALAGVLIVAVGLAAPFAVNAIATLGIIAALIWWKPPASKSSNLPPEHVFGAIRAGVRYVSHSAQMKATLGRALLFFLFASAYWAMLPLIARNVLEGGASLYGILMGCVGGGAVAGAVLLPKIKARLGANGTVVAGTIGTAAVLVSFALVPNPIVAGLASAIGGVSWIAVLSSMHVSAQTALPDWVRARGLSVFLTVFFGSMTVGSLLWGQVAASFGIPTALLAAAAGAVLMIPLGWKLKLGGKSDIDHAPSLHWPEPVLADADEEDPGPVMLQARYRIAVENKDRFLGVMAELREARQRSGAYSWSLVRSTHEAEIYVETWFEHSWIDHLRHHERVSEADKAIQAQVWALHMDGDRVPVAHYFTVKPSN